MASNYTSAVRTGAMAAGRLHRTLRIRPMLEEEAGSVDVFDAIRSLDLPLLLRPLKSLLGAYLNEPNPGLLVTTERPMSIQRFTAAHELGHYFLGHEPSLDDESILRRMPIGRDPGVSFQEIEADAFAVAFMIPKWLIHIHASRQSWTVDSFREPMVVYQLSLRLGASYEATCRSLVRYGLIDMSDMHELLQTAPRRLKTELLHDYRPSNYRGDVWLLTERDAGTRISGSRNDLFVLRLNEHSDGGYLWNFDQLTASGFAIVRDERESEDEQSDGTNAVRRVTAARNEASRGRMAIDERRPWLPVEPLTTLALEFDLTGPEEVGLSRAERRHLLEAA